MCFLETFIEMPLRHRPRGIYSLYDTSMTVYI